jgi:hypothetical protein
MLTHQHLVRVFSRDSITIDWMRVNELLLCPARLCPTLDTSWGRREKRNEKNVNGVQSERKKR